MAATDYTEGSFLLVLSASHAQHPVFANPPRQCRIGQSIVVGPPWASTKYSASTFAHRVAPLPISAAGELGRPASFIVEATSCGAARPHHPWLHWSFIRTNPKQRLQRVVDFCRLAGTCTARIQLAPCGPQIPSCNGLGGRGGPLNRPGPLGNLGRLRWPSGPLAHPALHGGG